MSNDQTPQSTFQQVADDMTFDFDMFTNEGYFGDNDLPSCDFPLPSIENSNDVSGTFFDSAIDFDFDFDVGGVHDDMSVWPSGDLSGHPGEIKAENLASSPPFKVPEDLPVGPIGVTSLASQHTDALPTPISTTPPGPIETLWRPLVNSSPTKKAPVAAPTRVRAPPKPRAQKPKVAGAAKAAPKAKANKVVKTKKPATTRKRTISAPSDPPRGVQELYNLPWFNLSQEEKGRLLLPLLQGIDPNTGIKIDEPGTLLPPPDFEMIGEDIFGTGDSGAKLMGTSTPKKQRKPRNLKTSSPPATTTQNGDTFTVSGTGASFVPDMLGETSFNNNTIDLTGENTTFINNFPDLFGGANDIAIDFTKNTTAVRDIDAEDAARFRARLESFKQQKNTPQSPVPEFTFDTTAHENMTAPFNEDINAALFRACREFNEQFDKDKDAQAAAIQAQAKELTADIFAGYQPAVQGLGLGGPCGNGFIGSAVQQTPSPTNNTNVANAGVNNNGMDGAGIGQIPAPSSDYGRQRQQEALERNAMLRAAGRRR